MPLKLVPPRPGKSPYYSVRGTHHGVYVDRSTKSPGKAQAAKFLIQWRDEIERGLFLRPGEKTFLDAAVEYMAAHDDHRFLERLVEHFANHPIRTLSQDDINNAAIKLYPKASPATRNRQVYTPVSAILKHAGIELNLRRPKGWRGERRTDWYSQENAFKLFHAADALDREFGLYLRFICYTGLRLSEALTLEVAKLELERGYCYVGKTKNGDPRGIHLPAHLVEAFRQHTRGLERLGDRVFRFRKNGRLYELMNKVKKAAGLEGLPGKFHIFRHTYGTWMTVHGGLDAEGLVATGVWRDEGSARRYRHTVTSEAARRADLLPVESKTQAPEGIETSRQAKIG
jgi:integrase